MSQQQQTYKLSAAQILPTAQHTATVFMVHGFGDIQQGNGWADLFQIVAGEMPWVKWVFPHSPKIKMTFRGGEVLVGIIEDIVWLWGGRIGVFGGRKERRSRNTEF